MGRVSTRYRAAGSWPFLVILAAGLAVEIGNPYPPVVVEAQTLPAAVVPPIPAALPPGLTAAPPGDSSIVSTYVMSQFNRVTNSISAVVEKKFSDCVANIQSDSRSTFDFTQSSNVLLGCATHAGQDFMSRVCGKAEIELYFANIEVVKDAGIPPNINCNSDDWPTACEAGWAAATTANSSLATAVPVRTSDAKSCCEGFFCPRGLTCMMPCPLGAWCPLAEFNENYSRCDPYGYPSKPGNALACGGADVWLSYHAAPGTFCAGTSSNSGKYCPDPVTQEACEKGHYCRVGSTRQTRCTFLTQCSREGLQSENLKSYGILLVVVLFTFLLLIYNCFDQVIHIRERRKSKVRDIAAREARESVSAVERWKRAKEGAKAAAKKAVTFSRELSRTLSRGKSKLSTSRIDVPFPATDNERFFDDDHDQADTGPGVRNAAHPAALLGGDVYEERRATEQEFHLLGDPSADPVGGTRVPWSHDLYPVEGPRSSDLYEAVQFQPELSGANQEEEALPTARGVELREARPSTVVAHTNSQVYKYAYGQIEKEKSKQQSKPASLKELVESSGFRDMIEGKGRLQMELSFVDLCLVLKGSGKRILSHVTGKFCPCQVTAVMGPSGAGKTTFLNALAGKETSSHITGQVFINGHPGFIQSYKRIIGFVPQDDVVHGNLTVEENLFFSAKYRLPLNLPRQERILVVERIINRLDLISIRDSLVGTVETRGISGGQRKRVNVGMELVIEPSLLILDEPTSGLDSTSSRLVVQSLRREATLGVNVCLVVHQPSYGLFRMFDDVMLLAKGGYTVYLGPVAEIEGYFSALGFEVPDRINPPDYYMDMLEGLVVPDNDPSFDLKSLPVLWMCHKGYHIPLDLQAAGGRRVDTLRITYDAPKSLARELWDELRIYVLVRWDIFKTDFSSIKDLSGRQTPGFWRQFRLILERVTKQKFRESRLHAQDYIILLLAGICLGILADWKDENLGGTGYLYTIIAVALLVMIASLRTFSADKLEFWRESSSGINRLAFFLAKDTGDHFNTLLKPLVYLSMFYFFNNPRSSFALNFVITMALVYCCTGIAYVPAIILNPQPAQLLSVFLPVIATLLVANPRTGALAKIAKLSYASWALEAYTIANAKRYTGVWFITRCEALRRSGYRLDNANLCLGILFGYGIAARIVAYLCLLMFNRKRQK